MIILCINRAPTGKLNVFFDILYDLITKLNNQYLNHKIIISGNFNIDFKIDNDNKKEFISLLEIFNLHITITTPTRITCYSETIIDNIITNVDKDEIVNIQNDFYGLADHKGQIISLKNNALATVQEASIHKRIFNPTNENKFRELLNASDWEITETNTAFEQFYETLPCCFESAFPVRKIKCRPKPNNRG
ncbi:hypothetical protein JTB14_030455 [Gonioctena quinquepunctata]|nr:hypothetical protein JTB14_030455 [Gonioctena quinquepunctata]